MSSFDSVNGPSTTERLPSRTVTREPFALGCSPSVWMSTPALVISSRNGPIRSIISAVGGAPASEDSSALSNPRYRISRLQSRRRSVRAIARRAVSGQEPYRVRPPVVGLLPLNLRTQPLFALADLGRDVVAEVRHLVERPQLEHGLPPASDPGSAAPTRAPPPSI